MTDLVQLRYHNQLLDQTPYERPADVVGHFGAMQAQDFLGALWAVGLRTRGAGEATVERALAQGEIVRSWPLRGTLHFVAARDLRWLLALLAPRVIARAERRLRELGIDGHMTDRALEAFGRALQGGARLTRDEMRGVLEAAGIDTGGQRGYHLLWRCALEGLICLGPRQGKQQTFVLLDGWVPPAAPLPRDEALARLAARYFSAHGPATRRDFTWWSGLAAADARQALELVGAQLRQQLVDGEACYLAPPADDLASQPQAATARLLPAFDEYLVGYADRRAVLEPGHASRVNAGGGLLGPTIVLDRRIAGTWKRTLSRKAVTVHARFFQAPSSKEAAALEPAAEAYGRFLGRAPALELDPL